VLFVGLPSGGVHVQDTRLFTQSPPEVPFTVVYPDGILQLVHSCAAADFGKVPASTTSNGKAAASSKARLANDGRRRNGRFISIELSLAIQNIPIGQSSRFPAGCS